MSRHFSMGKGGGCFDTHLYVDPQLGPGLDTRVAVRQFVQQQCEQHDVFWVRLGGLPPAWRLPGEAAGTPFAGHVPPPWVFPAPVIAAVETTYVAGTVPKIPLIALDALSIVFHMFNANSPPDPGTRGGRLALAVEMWLAEDAFYRNIGVVVVAVVDTIDGLAFFDSRGGPPNNYGNWRRSNPPNYGYNFGLATPMGQLRRDFLRWLHVEAYPYYVHDHTWTGWVANDEPLHADAACEYLMRHGYRGHPVLFGDAGDQDKFILQSGCVLAF
ncbi:MAG: hypothetical protein AAFV01_17235, partial [Bacteroidota bacterium]